MTVIFLFNKLLVIFKFRSKIPFVFVLLRSPFFVFVWFPFPYYKGLQRKTLVFFYRLIFFYIMKFSIFNGRYICFSSISFSLLLLFLLSIFVLANSQKRLGQSRINFSDVIYIGMKITAFFAFLFRILIFFLQGYLSVDY